MKKTNMHSKYAGFDLKIGDLIQYHYLYNNLEAKIGIILDIKLNKYNYTSNNTGTSNISHDQDESDYKLNSDKDKYRNSDFLLTIINENNIETRFVSILYYKIL